MGRLYHWKPCNRLPLFTLKRVYPEGRACRRPTTRQLIDVFEPIVRHTIHRAAPDEFEIFTTELSPIRHTILTLLGISTTDYAA